MTVDIATLAIRIDSTQAHTAAHAMDRMRDAGARAEQQATSLDAVSRKLSQALQLLGVGAGVGAIIRMADEYTKFNAQIKLATQSQREYAQAVDDVRRIANTAQQDLAATGTLYARIANGTRELGVQQKQVAAITETVNLALKVSGATAAESASAQLQLSQAFASGTLRGEEFNAVNEAAPRLMKALADGMGVPISALREMASEGKVTSQIMSKVLPSALEQLRAEAKQVQTISGAFTVLKNNVMEFIGTQAQASGTVAVLTGAIGLLADNLNVLVGVLGTVTAVAVVNWLAAWTAKTYERIAAAYAQVAAENAVRMATIAAAEAQVASAGATAAGLQATQAAIVIAREEMAARLSVANANIQATQATIANTDANILQARTAIAASSAAGALSAALRVLRDSTRELNVQEALRRGLQADLAIAEQARAVSLAELAILGQQQTRVSAQVTAATAAQVAAQNALTAANGATAASVGMLSRAVGLLGGPIGVVITLLGVAATAWSVWGSKSEGGNKQAAESFDEAHARIVKGLDEQIAKNERLIQLQSGGISKTKAERDLPIVEQLSKASKMLDDINNRAGDFAVGKGKSNTDVLFEREKVLKSIVELTGKMQKRDASDDAAAVFGPAAQALASVRERLTGVNKQYLDDLKALKTARDANAIGEQEYIALVSKLATETWKASDAGKDLAASGKAQLDARLEVIKSGIAREKSLREEGVVRISELNRQGLAGDAEVFNAKHAAALAAGKDAAAIFDAEIAALSSYNGKDAAERIANNAKIKDLGGQRTEALRASLVAAEQLSNAYAYDKDKPARDAEAASRKEIVAINDQIDATERQIAAYNKLPSAVTAAAISQLEEQKVALAGFEGSEKVVADIDAKIAAYGRLAAAQSKLQGLDAGTDVAKAEQLLKILQAVDEAARQAAQGMTDSFGRVGTAIGGLTTALTGYAVQQQAIAAQLAAVKADPKNSAQKIAQAEIAASKASAQAQIKSYGDMAGAAKGFFSENSKGYKTLQAAEKAYRAVEMVMAIQSMVQKLFAVNAVTAATVAGEATKTAAVEAGTAAQVTSDMVKGTSAAAVGVATQAEGDPYTAWARMAAMAAAMAALGFSVGGGGSGKSVSQQRQESQGTGTVFGDSTAKSDSIKRSIELAANNSSIELDYTRNMLASLRGIESSLSGLGNLLIRTSGISGDLPETVNGSTSDLVETLFGHKLLGSAAGNFAANVSNAIFGGRVTALDGGVTIDPVALGKALSAGVNASKYVDTKKSGGLFHSDKYSTQYTDLGDAADRQFSAVIANIAGSVSAAADLLGLGGNAFTAHLNQFVVDIGKISLKDLDGEEIQAALEAVFSKLGDDMAQFGVAGLEQFQQVGEGYFETLTRVATNYANLDSILASSGTTFGQTGIASIAARERLIALAGGIDDLATQAQSFNESFLTEAERLAPVQKYVTDQLAAMGLQSLDTRDKFKDYVLGLANSGALATEAGAQQYTALLALAEAFAKTHAATVDLTKSEQAIADERADLQNKLDELTMTQEQLAAKARAAIDGHNLALYDQVIAAQAAKDAAAASAEAQQAAADAIIKAQESAKAAIQTLGNALADSMKRAEEAAKAFRALNDSLLLSDSSTLSPEQKYLEAKRQFEGADASNLQAAEKAFLDASKAWFGGSAGYAADFQAVIARNAAEAARQAAQAQAIIDMWKNYTGVPKVDGSHRDGLERVPRDGYIAELHRDERVQTASEVRDGDAAVKEANLLLADVVAELRADKVQRGAAATAQIGEIRALRSEVAGLKRKVAALESA
jgi:tape measure domain-containing protein